MQSLVSGNACRNKTCAQNAVKDDLKSFNGKQFLDNIRLGINDSPQNTHKSYILNNYMNGKMYGEGLDSKSMLNKCSLAKWMHWRSAPY